MIVVTPTWYMHTGLRYALYCQASTRTCMALRPEFPSYLDRRYSKEWPVAFPPYVLPSRACLRSSSTASRGLWCHQTTREHCEKNFSGFGTTTNERVQWVKLRANASWMTSHGPSCLSVLSR